MVPQAFEQGVREDALAEAGGLIADGAGGAAGQQPNPRAGAVQFAEAAGGDAVAAPAEPQVSRISNLLLPGGCPDDRDAAMAAATALGATIEVVYYGDGNDSGAAGFMRGLATRTRGRFLQECYDNAEAPSRISTAARRLLADGR